jgi:DsbC/DsbD-like thiol-disulfide interchange protein
MKSSRFSWRRCGVAGALAAAMLVAGYAAPAWALASQWSAGHKTQARLLAGRSTPSDGGALLAFVEIELAPGWKTYWRSPGDAGLPPAFDWSKSTNVAKADVKFPAPKLFVDKSGHTIGYEGRLFLPVVLIAERPGEPMSLAVDVHYGICKEICVPIDASLALEVPASETALAPAAALMALDRVPRAQDKTLSDDPVLVRAESQIDGAAPKIVVEAKFPGDPSEAAVFLEAAGGQFLPVPAEASAGPDGSKVFEAALGEAVDLAELRGKAVTVTLVGEAGASYATIVIP